jgi:hypothetical protein
MTKDEINAARATLKELMAILADCGENIGRPAQEVAVVRHSIGPAVDEMCDLAIKGLETRPEVAPTAPAVVVCPVCGRTEIC